MYSGDILGIVLSASPFVVFTSMEACSVLTFRATLLRGRHIHTSIPEAHRIRLAIPIIVPRYRRVTHPAPRPPHDLTVPEQKAKKNLSSLVATKIRLEGGGFLIRIAPN